MSRFRVPGEDVPLPLAVGLTALGLAGALGTASEWSGAGAPVAPFSVSAAAPPPAAPAPPPLPPPSTSVAPRPSVDAGAQACPRFIVVFSLAASRPPASASAPAAQLARWMVAHADATAVIDGHADALGSDHGNLDLSRRRAASVAQLLEGGGVAASRLTVRGFGAFSPLEGAPEEAAANRRVVVHIRSAGACPISKEEVLGP